MRNLPLVLALALLLPGCQKDRETATQQAADRYVILDAGGLAGQAGVASCAEDLQTGLTWEVKSGSPGLRFWQNTYTWFNPTESVGELDYRGVADGGRCAESDCDTWDYVRAVNSAGLCGHFDWRMPSRDELMSISMLSRAASPPTADPEVFPFIQAAEYWTGFDYSTQHESAWAWNFHYGHDRVDWKREAKYVRLVRGTAKKLDSVKE